MPKPQKQKRAAGRQNSGRKAKKGKSTTNKVTPPAPVPTSENAGEELELVEDEALAANFDAIGEGEKEGESQPSTTTNVAVAWCKEDLTIANERLEAARANFDRDYNKIAEEMRQEEKEIDARLEMLNKKMEDAAKVHGNPNASGDDILEINAGGKVIVAKRSTLTQHTVGTEFGALFSGRWEKKLQRDNHGHIFLDVNSECFQAIVAYFNELMISSEDNPPDPPSVDAEYEHILLQQIDLFGLWDRVGMPRYSKTMRKNPRREHELVTDRFSDDINIAFSEKRACLPHIFEKIQSLESRFHREEPFIYKFASGDVKDVITFNVVALS